MEVVLHGAEDGATTINLPDSIFGREYNEALIHQLVTAFQAGARQGTRAQKDRGQVHHSTKKPFNQKGTGRARAGMTSSPLWRGGGRIFPNQPDENFTQKVNKKMYRAGMASILSQLVRDERLAVVIPKALEAPKTKMFVAQLKSFNLSATKDSSLMMISEEFDENLFLAARNLHNVYVTETRFMDPVSLIFYKKLLLTPGVVKQIEELYA